MKKSDKLIVLDLDETLFHCDIHAFTDKYDYIFTLLGDNNQSFYTLLRPFLEEFLDYIKKNFRYGVYTAASEDYALEHIDRIGLKPEFLLSNKNCTLKRHKEMYSYYYLKRLSKVKKYQSLDKVIAIDDKRDSYKENYSNLIYIPPFMGSKDDKYLLNLIDFLKELKDIKTDIRDIEKRGWLIK